MPEPHTLIVIGATGDLTGRLLLPALARMWDSGDLAEGFRFVGAGPQDWDEATFRTHARARLAAHAGDLDRAQRESFLRTVTYRQVDVTQPSSVGRLLGPWVGPGVVTLYLALPTHLLGPTVAALVPLGLPATVRVAVEKPFGDDLRSAMALNAALARAVSHAHNIFRVDHVLGMAIVQDLPRAIAAIHHPPESAGAPNIAEVEILWEETLALEGRAAFYDGAGALKDLLQNHLLQILCLVTLDTAELSGDGVSAAARLSAMRAIEVPTVDGAAAVSRRARYTAGRLSTSGGANGEAVPDYIAEAGVDPERNTETLAEVTLTVGTARWAGTRFVLRAGKAMSQRRRGVLIRFREAQIDRENGATPDPTEFSELWIDVDRPDTDQLDSGAHGDSGAPAKLEQIAYVTVLRNLLSGSDTLSVTAEQAELGWRLFEPIMQAWATDRVPLTEYPAGAG